MMQTSNQFSLPFADSAHIFPQKSQSRQCPVDHPWPTGVHGHKACGIVFEGIIEIGYVIIALEGRYSMGIEGILLTCMNPLQEGQTLVEGFVLQISGLCHERVADGRRLREQGWDPRSGCLLAACHIDRGNWIFLAFLTICGDSCGCFLSGLAGEWESNFASVFSRCESGRHGLFEMGIWTELRSEQRMLLRDLDWW